MTSENSTGWMDGVSPVRPDESLNGVHSTGDFDQEGFQPMARDLRGHHWEDRLLQQLRQYNEFTRGVTRGIVLSNSQTELVEAVCDELAAIDRFTFVWIGDVDIPAGDIVPRSWAGDGEQYLDDVPLRFDEAETPSALSVRECEMKVVEDLTTVSQKSAWGEWALAHDFRSVLSVPLLYEGVLYGVLSVASKDVTATEGVIPVVLNGIGGTVASALNAHVTKESGGTDTGLELVIGICGIDDPLRKLARHAESSLSVESELPVDGDSTRVLVSSENALPEVMLDGRREMAEIEFLRHVADRDGTHTYEARIIGETIESTVSEFGASVESIRVGSEGFEVTANLPDRSELNPLIEHIRDSHPDTHLVTCRKFDRRIDTKTAFRADFRERLTDRQREVLRLAYLNGYYEWPRENTGEDIAGSLGISGTAINRLLRVGQKKLLDLVYEDP